MLTPQLRSRFAFDSFFVTAGMAASVVGALVLASAMAVHNVLTAASRPVIKLEATKAPPTLSLAAGQRWHLFLSHIWSTGQDQCATIKRQLCSLLPGVSVFLDVDDLESIDRLEDYVDASATISIFVSKGYFNSKNCLREAQCALCADALLECLAPLRDATLLRMPCARRTGVQRTSQVRARPARGCMRVSAVCMHISARGLHTQNRHFNLRRRCTQR